MDDPTAYRTLRGPSPFVLAMKTRLAPPPPLADPLPLPAAVPPALLPPPYQPEKRRRGRPRNCDRLPPPPGFSPSPPQTPTLPAPSRPPLLAQGQGKFSGFHPHILQIGVGEEIIPKITALSKINGRVICVLSVLGAVQEATLLLSSGVTSHHKGPLEIIRLFGSIFTPNDQGCLRVTLASADSSVIGGIITGPLIAATPVQAVVASFYSDVDWPNKAPKIFAHYPNSQYTISNGLTMSSEHANPGYASCTTVDRNESSQVDVKPSIGMLNLALCTAMDQNESSEVDVKPSIGMLNFAPCR